MRGNWKPNPPLIGTAPRPDVRPSRWRTGASVRNAYPAAEHCLPEWSYVRPRPDSRSHPPALVGFGHRERFKYFYEINLNSVGDELSRFLQQLPDVTASQRASTEAGELPTCFERAAQFPWSAD